MSDTIRVETESMSRVAYARIGPNEDLVLGVEKPWLAEGFRNAFVRRHSAVWSAHVLALSAASTSRSKVPLLKFSVLQERFTRRVMAH